MFSKNNSELPHQNTDKMQPINHKNTSDDKLAIRGVLLYSIYIHRYIFLLDLQCDLSSVPKAFDYPLCVAQ